MALSLIAWRSAWPLLPTPVLLKHRLATSDLSSLDGVIQAAAGGLAALISSPALVVLVVAALLLLTLPADADPRARERRLLLAIFVTATLIHVQFGRTGGQNRYEVHLIALGVVAVSASLPRHWNDLWPAADRWRVAAAAALATIALFALAHRS